MREKIVYNNDNCIHGDDRLIMNNIFSFLLPAKPDLSADAIPKAIAEWVNSSSFYSFHNLNLTHVEGYETYHCSEADLEYIKAMDQVDYGYIGARLSKSDASNVTWSADFIYEHSSDGSFFYVQLSRSIEDPEGLTNMSIRPQMPDVVKQIMWQDMLLDDAGFQITDEPFDLSPSVLRTCKDAFVRKTSPILPIIFANCSGRPDMKKTVEATAKDLAGMAHMIVAVSDDEVFQWRQIDDRAPWVPVFDGATIYFPRIGIVKRVSFQEEFEDILICMTAYVSQQNLPANTMTWDKLKSLSDGEYCLLNKQMAEFIKTSRKKSGLSQAELASKVGVTGLTISRLETLRITRVKSLLLRQIEKALNLSIGTISAIESGNDGRNSGMIAPTGAERSSKWTGSTQNLFCRKCGTKLFSDSVFCHQCGTKLPDGCP